MHPYHEQLHQILQNYPNGITVADLCADTGLRIQSVSTSMTKIERLGKARWIKRARSNSTQAIGKVWVAV